MHKKIATLLLLFVLAPTASATIIGYNFDWIGTGGYTMTGMFKYDDVNAGDGAIRDAEVESLMFEGFLNGGSIGVQNGAHLLAGFNFNFDTVLAQFFLGGMATSDSGQRWNFGGAGLGFGAGSIGSVLTIGNQIFGNTSIPIPLSASIKSDVPEPSTALLIAIGLIGYGFSAKQSRCSRKAIV